MPLTSILGEIWRFLGRVKSRGSMISPSSQFSPAAIVMVADMHVKLTASASAPGLVQLAARLAPVSGMGLASPPRRVSHTRHCTARRRDPGIVVVFGRISCDLLAADVEVDGGRN